MTTVQVQGKKITAIKVVNSLAMQYSDLAKKYAEEAKGYRDEAQSYANTINQKMAGLESTLANAEVTLNNSVDSAEIQLNTKIATLLGGIDEELKQLIGEE